MLINKHSVGFLISALLILFVLHPGTIGGSTQVETSIGPVSSKAPSSPPLDAVTSTTRFLEQPPVMMTGFLEFCHPFIPLQKSDSLYHYIQSDQSPELILINKVYPLADRFSPEAFLTDQGQLPSLKPEILMNTQVYSALCSLFEDAKKATISDLTLASGYRSIDYQKKLFKGQINKHLTTHTKEDAVALAGQVVAIPGTSEHHTGYAIDFISTTNYALTEAFEKTSAGAWLLEHAADYGFVLRYPKGKQDITSIIYEPWHYRYVGQPHARIMTELNLTLEEYHEYIQKKEEIIFTDPVTGKHYHVLYSKDIHTLNAPDYANIPLDQISVSQYSTKDFILTIEYKNPEH